MANGSNYSDLNPVTVIRKPRDMLSGTRLTKPVWTVFGASERRKLEWNIGLATRDFEASEPHLLACYRNLSTANRCRKLLRASAKSSAFKMINKARKTLRDNKKALDQAIEALAEYDRQSAGR